ncbi:MAG: antibiotic biosynthesis monooxygenase [Clostridia bacterium]|nr:antibiotic biosynthesis monooxygenase [Clostridia bacterium]MBQ4576014.1 antibiotic biosynthesis monooxygenase [Clostridia bacterium]
MIVLFVSIEVKPECAAAFEEISRYNHENAVKEEGCLRFDVLHSTENPNKYNLYEVYSDKAAVDFHKTTEHYRKWAAEVEPMCASPRSKVVLEEVAFTK